MRAYFCTNIVDSIFFFFFRLCARKSFHGTVIQMQLMHRSILFVCSACARGTFFGFSFSNTFLVRCVMSCSHRHKNFQQIEISIIVPKNKKKEWMRLNGTYDTKQNMYDAHKYCARLCIGHCATGNYQYNSIWKKKRFGFVIALLQIFYFVVT